jgi:glycosyltransferase involved in cell wall biosynthesis
MCILRVTVPSVRLDMAGTGSAEEEVIALIHKLGISDRVTIRGELRGAAKEAWFAGIHVLAVPSISFENLPFSAFEAQARGRPVVGTDIGGIPEAVRPCDGGRLVPANDPAALASALAEILGSAEIRRTLGAQARARTLREFTPEVHIARLLRAYHAVLGGLSLASFVEADDLPELTRESPADPHVQGRRVQALTAPSWPAPAYPTLAVPRKGYPDLTRPSDRP